MTLQVHTPPEPPQFDRLAFAREILRAEAAALEQVAGRLDASFLKAVDLIYHGCGRVCLTGTGKSADVGQKIAGTLNSTGTRAYVLDATKAVHGDLGMIHPDDVILALSHSGETEELVRLLGPFKEMAAAVIGLTSKPGSTLARLADATIAIGPIQEVCPMGLAPSTSTTAMIAVGDALAFVLSEMRQFQKEDFARLHPAGSLGRKLMRVETVMRKGDEIRLAPCTDTVREVFAHRTRHRRRTGAVMLVDGDGKLAGIFTDSDLARLFEQRKDDMLDRPIADVMTRNPITVAVGARMLEAMDLLSQRKISELPVVDAAGRPAGLIDITDVIGLAPAEASRSPAVKVA